VAVEREFPGIDIDQLYAAHDIAAAILKARTRRYARRWAKKGCNARRQGSVRSLMQQDRPLIYSMSVVGRVFHEIASFDQ
jgi:hypothetical protein